MMLVLMLKQDLVVETLAQSRPQNICSCCCMSYQQSVQQHDVKPCTSMPT